MTVVSFSLSSWFHTRSILVVPIAARRHLISIVVNICCSFAVTVQFWLWWHRDALYHLFPGAEDYATKYLDWDRSIVGLYVVGFG